MLDQSKSISPAATLSRKIGKLAMYPLIQDLCLSDLWTKKRWSLNPPGTTKTYKFISHIIEQINILYMIEPSHTCLWTPERDMRSIASGLRTTCHVLTGNLEAKSPRAIDVRTRVWVTDLSGSAPTIILETLEGTSKCFSCEVLSPVEPNEIILVYSWSSLADLIFAAALERFPRGRATGKNIFVESNAEPNGVVASCTQLLKYNLAAYSRSFSGHCNSWDSFVC